MQENLPLMSATDKSKVYNTNLIEFIEFKNMLTLAETILISALNRRESRGAHFRSDALERDETFKAHTIIYKEGGTLCTYM